jgi:hypothetical protein
LEVVIKVPTTIVEWCPAPVIVGNPSVAELGHYPMTLCTIGMETLFYSRKPDISVTGIPDPVTIRCKLIVKYLKAYSSVDRSFCLLRRNHARKHHDSQDKEA